MFCSVADYNKRMVNSPKEYTFKTDPIKSLVKDFIIKNHYTNSCPGIVRCFTLEEAGVVVGACIFSIPSRQNIGVPGCYDIVELSRLFIIDDTPKNTESYFIAQCLKWLRINTEFEAVVSFADTTQGHSGAIYKATNFVLLGQTGTNYHYETLAGHRLHKRQVWDRAKKNNISEKEQSIKDNLTKIEELPKNKFVYYLKKQKHANIVYGLIDPITDHLKYIGKSEQGTNRYKEHLKSSSLKIDCRKNYWLRNILGKGLKPELIILETCTNPEELFEAEEFWYQYFLGLGCDLVNSTDCGKGTRGYKHKDTTKKFLSDLKKGKNKGKPLPQGMRTAKIHSFINGIEHRECSLCYKYKPLSEFIFSKKRNRWNSYCKSCQSIYQAEWKKKNPSKLLTPEEYRKSRLRGIGAARLKTIERFEDPHARQKLREQRSKPVKAIHMETGQVLCFPSALAAKTQGFNNTNIGVAIKNNKPYKNYLWSFDKK